MEDNQILSEIIKMLDYKSQNEIEKKILECIDDAIDTQKEMDFMGRGWSRDSLACLCYRDIIAIANKWYALDEKLPNVKEHGKEILVQMDEFKTVFETEVFLRDIKYNKHITAWKPIEIK